MNKRLKAALGLVAIAGVVYAFSDNEKTTVSASTVEKETFRLVHAIGNTERINAKGLSKAECEARKQEQKAVATSLGVGGSVTCLPENLFEN